MLENNGLEAFISDLDKIIFGEPIDPSEYEQYDTEHKELLYLAQLLAQADYTPETRGARERLWSKMHKNGELEDDDLDLVAGGVNLHELFEKIIKRKDI
ncbi:MAG: hypothetical protein ACOX5W_00230 [Bacillota bacterium]|jgi:hypothetical protein